MSCNAVMGSIHLRLDVANNALAQVEIDTLSPDGSLMKLVLYGIPTRPGRCRLTGRQVGSERFACMYST